MKIYIVWTRSRHRFETLAEAMQFASDYERRTGNIVAITESTARRRQV